MVHDKTLINTGEDTKYFLNKTIYTLITYTAKTRLSSTIRFINASMHAW